MATFLFFCYHNNIKFNYNKTLQCILSTCKLSSQSIHKQTPNASVNVTTLFVYKLLKAASGHAAVVQHLDIVVQKGLIEFRKKPAFLDKTCLKTVHSF